jgi:ERCC4-type nuclease
LKIDDLPIPGWQKERIKKETRISTIEDILTSQSPATELKKARGIGNVKSQKIYEIAKKTLEEFLA